MGLKFSFGAAAGIIAAALSISAPALAQHPLAEVLSRLGQAELTAGDGPSYRAIVAGGAALRPQVAGDGLATMTVPAKAGKKDVRFFSNRHLDALDAALANAPLNGQPAGCYPETGVIFETIIDGAYRYGVECAPGPLAKTVRLERGCPSCGVLPDVPPGGGPAGARAGSRRSYSVGRDRG